MRGRDDRCWRGKGSGGVGRSERVMFSGEDIYWMVRGCDMMGKGWEG